MPAVLYTLTSDLHKEAAIPASQENFIRQIEAAMGERFIFRGSDFSDYGRAGNPVIYVRTGGTEGLFKSLGLQGDVRLLASGGSNSLAASMEILSYLRSLGRRGEILHGTPSRIAARISAPPEEAAPDASPFIGKLPPVDLGGIRLGVIGRPSDWLISSGVDYAKARSRLGVELVDIPIGELLERLRHTDDLRSFKGSEAIYDALKDIVREHGLYGLTIRCFDLLDAVHNTGCLALARLNAEGIPAACEGDIPALLSMAYLMKVKGRPGFQCNLSRIDGDNLLFAHCTVPLTMAASYRYDTHFESGLGTAIKAQLPPGEVEIFKIAPDLESFVLIPGRVVANTDEKNLCRTQIVVNAPDASGYFLTSPLANHHVVSYVRAVSM